MKYREWQKGLSDSVLGKSQFIFSHWRVAGTTLYIITRLASTEENYWVSHIQKNMHLSSSYLHYPKLIQDFPKHLSHQIQHKMELTGSPLGPGRPGSPSRPGVPSMPGRPGGPGKPGSPFSPFIFGEVRTSPGSPLGPGLPGAPGGPGNPWEEKKILSFPFSSSLR